MALDALPADGELGLPPFLPSLLSQFNERQRFSARVDTMVDVRRSEENTTLVLLPREGGDVNVDPKCKVGGEARRWLAKSTAERQRALMFGLRRNEWGSAGSTSVTGGDKPGCRHPGCTMLGISVRPLAYGAILSAAGRLDDDLV